MTLRTDRSTVKNLRDQILSDLYLKAKLEARSLAEFLSAQDPQQKGYFLLAEFNEILKKFGLQLENKDLERFAEQVNVSSPTGNRKLTINQLLFFFEGLINEDLREVLPSLHHFIL